MRSALPCRWRQCWPMRPTARTGGSGCALCWTWRRWRSDRAHCSLGCLRAGGAGVRNSAATSSLSALTIHEAADLLARRECRSVDLTRAVLERIDAVDGRVRAYLTVLADRAMSQAEEADHRLARGEGERLTGIPIALKDVLCLAGERTTAASRI